MKSYTAIKNENMTSAGKMDETGDCFVKQSEPDSKRQILHAFAHINNLDLDVWRDGEPKGYCERGDDGGYLGGGRRPTDRQTDRERWLGRQ